MAKGLGPVVTRIAALNLSDFRNPGAHPESLINIGHVAHVK